MQECLDFKEKQLAKLNQTHCKKQIGIIVECCKEISLCTFLFIDISVCVIKSTITTLCTV